MPDTTGVRGGYRRVSTEEPEKRYSAVVEDGVWLAPNACSICRKWLPPYKAGVPTEVADQYCWGHAAEGNTA